MTDRNLTNVDQLMAAQEAIVRSVTNNEDPMEALANAVSVLLMVTAIQQAQIASLEQRLNQKENDK